MEKKINQKNIFISEEEKTLEWNDVQLSLEKNFGSEIYKSWLKNIVLIKEYNDYLILGVPTRFFRDWIVSRYLDKMLELLKSFKLSINRVEFKITEELKVKQNEEFKDDIDSVTPIKDSILNYNRLSYATIFDNLRKLS